MENKSVYKSIWRERQEQEDNDLFLAVLASLQVQQNCEASPSSPQCTEEHEQVADEDTSLEPTPENDRTNQAAPCLLVSRDEDSLQNNDSQSQLSEPENEDGDSTDNRWGIEDYEQDEANREYVDFSSLDNELNEGAACASLTYHPDSQHNQTPSIRLRGGLLTLRLGVLTRQKTQAIVHVTAPDGSFKGGLSKAFEKKFGDAMKVCYESALKDRKGEFVTLTELDGFYILHVTLKRGKNQLESSINGALKEISRICTEEKITSLSLPPLGTTRAYGYDAEMVVQVMVSRIQLHLQGLREINIIVHDLDEMVHTIFENYFKIGHEADQEDQCHRFDEPQDQCHLFDEPEDQCILLDDPPRDWSRRSNMEHYSKRDTFTSKLNPRKENHSKRQHCKTTLSKSLSESSYLNQVPTSQARASNCTEQQASMPIQFSAPRPHRETSRGSNSKKYSVSWEPSRKQPNDRPRTAGDLEQGAESRQILAHRGTGRGSNPKKYSSSGDQSRRQSNDRPRTDNKFGGRPRKGPQGQSSNTRHEPDSSVEYMAYTYEPKTPKYWKNYRGDQPIKNILAGMLNAVTGTNHSKVKVEVDDDVFKTIVRMVNDTFDPRLVGKGNDAKGLQGFSKLWVCKVERIENPDLFQKYVTARQHLFQEIHRNLRKCKLIERICKDGCVKTQQFVQDCQELKTDMFQEVNECYLFHGTKKKNVKTICETGLDCRLTHPEAMLGQGIYGAECATKADQYADDRDKRTVGPDEKKTMFLTRMLLGDFFRCDSSNPHKYRRPPCKTSGCNRDDCTKHNSSFTSVVSECDTKLFREFVVYEKALCYPEYLITYERR